MSFDNIHTLLTTVCEYNTVRIIQVFSKQDTDWIRVRCLPSTSTLELTFLDGSFRVLLLESVEEATQVIHQALQSTQSA